MSGGPDVLLAQTSPTSPPNGPVYGQGDVRNPSVFWNVDLQSRGDGYYFVRGSGVFVCGVVNVLPVATGDSLLHPVRRPSISGLTGVWWLGALSDPANGYFNAVRLTSNSNKQPEDTVGSPQWTVTQNPQKVSLSCTTCTAIDVISQEPSIGCTDPQKVKIKVNYSGFQSAEFILIVNRPSRLAPRAPTMPIFPVRSTSPNAEDGGLPPSGFLSLIHYRFIDECNNAMTSIKINEKFLTTPGDFGSNYPGENWAQPTADSWDGFQAPFDWYDGMASSCNPCTPNSQLPPYPPVALSTTKVDWITQEFRAGSKIAGAGIQVQRHRHQSYVDRGRHEMITSPVN